MTLDDVERYFKYVEQVEGTPVTPVMVKEYRRVLLLKDPCYYVGKLTKDEIQEIISTEPTYFRGINIWIGMYTRNTQRSLKG